MSSPARPILLCLALSPLALPAARVAAPVVAPADAPAAGAKTFDAILQGRFAADQPGAAVLVVQAGQVAYARGFGRASLELQVDNRPERVFRIGSVSKQFTAAAVMKLVEEGRVKLDGALATYLPNLPEAWRPVTVHQLLNHTSGIPSYTSNPTYFTRMREDLPGMKTLELLAAGQPMDFPPGTAWRYNNTGYYLLGLLIEKVEGRSYAEALQARFFGPLGLKDTRYGTETELIPGLVSGYTQGGRPAPYLSMTQPYAAGALVSTVADLARWTLALHAGKVVSADSLRAMTTPTRTRDGREHPYGYGLQLRRLDGRTLVGHGGGINGFVSYLEADPARQNVVVVLCNSDQPPIAPAFLTRRLLAAAAGTPIAPPKAVAVPAEQLARLAGSYQAEGALRVIALQDGRLTSRVGSGRAYPLIPTAPLAFAIEDSDTTLRFVVEGGKVLGVHRTADGGPEEPLQKRMERPTRTAVAFDPARFDAYVGTYSLAPGFNLRFWREGGRFFSQATGQGTVEIHPASETTFFLTVVEAELEFVKGADGKVDQVILTQGGRRTPAKRVE